MRWFEGSIPAAIAETKAERKLLMVYVHDASEDSVRMSDTLEKALADQLSASHYVALKLETGTTSFDQFAAFYPVLVLPSTYFIGDGGTPLEVVAGFQELDDFIIKVDATFKLQWPDGAPSSEAGATSLEDASSNAAVEGSSADVILAPDVAVTPPSVPVNGRLDSARAKIEEQNRERIRKENEAEKEREIERRRLGQEMAESQRTKEESVMKKRTEEIAREKAESAAAKEKIKLQIQRDREERKQRFEGQRRVKESQMEEKRERKEAEEAAASAALSAQMRSLSRLQYRLPDGGTVRREFSIEAPFSDVRAFIEPELRARGLDQFDLVHSLTRRTFQPTDFEKSLRDLDLAGPNALIVVPARTGSTRGSQTDEGFSLTNLFGYVVAPFVFFVNLLLGFFVRPSSSIAPTESTSTTQKSATAPASNSTGDVRRRTNVEGNIHRLRHDSDSDSDSNTWNGNSTQQM